MLGARPQSSQDSRGELTAVATTVEDFVETTRSRALTFLRRRRLRHEGNQYPPSEARLRAYASCEHGCAANLTQSHDYHLMLE